MSDLDPLDLDLQALGFPEGAAPVATPAQILGAAGPVGLAGWKLAGAFAATALLGAGVGAGVLHTLQTPVERVVQVPVQIAVPVEVLVPVEVPIEVPVEVPTEVLVAVPTSTLASHTCWAEPALAAVEPEPEPELDFDLTWLDDLPSPTLPEREPAPETVASLELPSSDALWLGRLGVGATAGPGPGLHAEGTVARLGDTRAWGQPTALARVSAGSSGPGRFQSASLGAGVTRTHLDGAWLATARREVLPPREGAPRSVWTPLTGPEVGVQLNDGRLRVAANAQVGPGVDDTPVAVVAGLSLSLQTALSR